MNSTILFKTGTNKNYLFNTHKKDLLFCHPVLAYLIKLYRGGVDVNHWVENQKWKKTRLENYEKFKKSEVNYFYKKFLLLLENGYLSRNERECDLSGRIKADDIKAALANLRQVTYETTDFCQLSCFYCGYGRFYNDYDKRKSKNLNVNTARRLLIFLTQLWNSHQNISHDKNIYISFYGGEPLLNFAFIKEMVNFSKTLELKHNRFIFSMTTNAILLEKHMDFLVENDFHLLISLDGDEKNNSYRVFHNGESAYQSILKNVQTLKKNYPAYFKRKVNFNAVLHKRNSVSEIHKYFKENFNKIPSISPLNTSGIKVSEKEEFWKTYSNINESLFQAEDYSFIEKDMFINLPNIKDVGIFLHKFSGHVFKNYNDFLFSANNQNRTPTGTCLPFSKKVFVTVNGKILPCERISHRYELGVVNDKTVDINFEKIAEKYNQYYARMQKQCKHCCAIDICTQCMFYLDIDDKNPRCNGFMNEETFSKYLSSHVSYIEKNPGIYSKIMKEVIIE